jgi:hypothetical protein
MTNQLQRLTENWQGQAQNAQTVGVVAQLNQWIPNTLPNVFPQIQVWPLGPVAYCYGHVHVFGCEHATTCKCGVASRPLPVKVCPTCGKKDE